MSKLIELISLLQNETLTETVLRKWKGNPKEGNAFIQMLLYFIALRWYNRIFIIIPLGMRRTNLGSVIIALRQYKKIKLIYRENLADYNSTGAVLNLQS